MIRVPTVNYLSVTVYHFLASGIEPSRGTRGEDIEALMPHARHSDARNGLSRVVWGQSVFDAPSGSTSPPSLPLLPLLFSLRSHNRGQRLLWRFTIRSFCRLASPTPSPTFPARASSQQTVLISIRTSVLLTLLVCGALHGKPCGLRSLRSLRAGDGVGLAAAPRRRALRRNSPLDPPSACALWR